MPDGVKCDQCEVVTPPGMLGHVCNVRQEFHRAYFEDGKAYATIGSGLVIRWKFKGRYDGEVNASRDGVSIDGPMPIMKAAGLEELEDVLAEALTVYLELAKDQFMSSTHRDAVKVRYKQASLFQDLEDTKPGP